MRYEDHDYQAYMLRIWRTTYQGQWQWHASLESPHTGERVSFTSLEQLFAFLKERCEGKEPALNRIDVEEDVERGRNENKIP
jgi:hypothetical protein